MRQTARLLLALACTGLLWQALACDDTAAQVITDRGVSSPGHDAGAADAASDAGQIGADRDLVTAPDAMAADAVPADRRVADHLADDASSRDLAATDSAAADDAAAAPPADLHVAPGGSGTTCTHAAPCDLATARARLRTLNDAMQRDLLVLLRGGRYRLDQAFTLGAEDSGSNGHFVIYQAYPGEHPELSGGESIDGWTLTDAARGIYRASVPAELRTRQLFVDGRRARRARSALDPPGFTVVTDGYQGSSDMDAWGNIGDVEMVDYMQWKAFRCALQSVSGGHIVMQQPCWSLAQWHTNLGMEEPTWIENAFELLDSPGEWYHDRSAAQIYYLPRQGEDLAGAEVIAARQQTLLRLDGAHHLQFRGLSFTHSTWLRPGEPEGYPVLQAGQLLSGALVDQPQLESTPGAVVVHDSTDLIFERNRFERLGAVGLRVSGGSKRCQIGGNLFRDISASALSLGNVDGATAPEQAICSDIHVTNNYIADIGVEYFDSPAILLTYARGCTISHNELHNLPYTGVSLGWGWGMQASVLADNSVSHNRIGHAMLRLNDGGLVYTLNTQPGASIAHNLLFSQVHDYGGIYLDQGSQHFSVVGNVVASTPRWYFLQPEVPPRAQDNTVHNNLADTTEVGCCGSQGCCTEVNTVSDNATFPPSAWPTTAQDIALAAGVDPAYSELRPATQRYEAEAYLHGGDGVGFHEIPSWLGADNAYRGDRVDVESCEACSNDHRVAGVVDGEWLAYDVLVPDAGSYHISFWFTGGGGGSLVVRVDGQRVGEVAVTAPSAREPSVGGRLESVALAAGMRRVVLELAGDLGFDFFEVWR